MNEPEAASIYAAIRAAVYSVGVTLTAADRASLAEQHEAER